MKGVVVNKINNVKCERSRKVNKQTTERVNGYPIKEICMLYIVYVIDLYRKGQCSTGIQNHQKGVVNYRRL